MSTDERIEEPTTTSAPIPKDGYYTAWVQLDTGGTMPAYVRVKDGLIMASDEDELKPSACSQFRPVSTQQFCGVWPSEAAMELETLRTANAALVEKVRRLEGDLETLDHEIGNRCAKLRQWGENLVRVGNRHIAPECDEWNRAKGQP